MSTFTTSIQYGIRNSAKIVSLENKRRNIFLFVFFIFKWLEREKNITTLTCNDLVFYIENLKNLLRNYWTNKFSLTRLQYTSTISDSIIFSCNTINSTEIWILKSSNIYDRSKMKYFEITVTNYVQNLYTGTHKILWY
jgi:hypothetical protein